MSSVPSCCTYCSKECKTSDSKPYPNPKSKDRIHFKCKIKKSLAEKQQKSSISNSEASTSTKPRSSFDLIDKLVDEKAKLDKLESEKKINQFIKSKDKQASKNNTTFFFDVKAGIAREKKRYLHHRNLSEIGSRYNDQGFQEEAVGRAYDHSGKDLMTLGDSSDEEQGKDSDKLISGELSHFVRDPSKPMERKLNEKRKSTKIRVDETNPCWFCLSSPKVEKHLIIKIGEYCYLALAKGGLFDEHFLIIPIEHVDSTSSAQNNEDALTELTDFKQTLINYFKDQSLGVVFFERYYRSVHWQVQAVPVPIDIEEGLTSRIKSITMKHYDKTNFIDLEGDTAIRDVIPDGVPYLYWEVGSRNVRSVTELKIGDKIPMQLARIVLSDSMILNCPDRVDWRNCVKDSQEYMDLVEQIKVKFRPYDRYS